MLPVTSPSSAALLRLVLVLGLFGVATVDVSAQSFRRADGSSEARPPTPPSHSVRVSGDTAKRAATPTSRQPQRLRTRRSEGGIQITHSASQTINPSTGIACSANNSTARNSYWRVFDLDAFNITSGFSTVSVDIGIEETTLMAAAPVSTIRLYTLDGAFVVANLTLVAEATYTLNETDDLKLVTVPIVGAFATGDMLVVEWDVPNLQGSGGGVFMGANGAGQTGPTYVSAADCALNEPTDLASIDFPDVHWVLNVNGMAGGGGNSANEVEPNDTPAQAQVLSGTSPIVLSGNIEVSDLGSITIPYTDGFQDDVEDLFRVTTSGVGLTLTLDGFTADLDLGLWNSTGTTLIELSNGTGTSEMVTMPTLAAGTYLIGVTVFDQAPGAPTSAYTLTVDGSLAGDPPPPAPSGLTATAGNGEVVLNWTAASASDVAGYHVYRATAPFTTTDGAMRLTGTLENDTDYDDDAVTNGTQYYYRVSAVDAGGHEGALSNQASATPINPRPTMVNVAVNRTFGDPETQANYRLIALPGNANTSLASTVTGTSGDNWRAFQELGSAGGNGSNQSECTTGCRFTPGEGFWLLADAPWSVSEAFPTVNLDGGGYSISVHPGWNIISNPLEIDIPWQRVQNANGVTRALNQWSGRWQETGSFASAQRGEAFYFFNVDRTSLTIPFAATAQPEPTASAQRSVTEGAFELTLSVRVGGEETATAVFSASPDAEVGLDDDDRFAPPSTFEQASLASVNESLETAYQMLRHDARPLGAEGYTFDLVLSAEPGTVVELVPGWGAEAEALDAVLVNEVSGERYTLSDGIPLRLRSASPSSRYVLHIGSPAFVNADRALPQEVEVGGYPNPFQTVTTIRYGLPEPGRVQIAVYDLLGKRVAVLAQREEQEAGYHTVVWDAGSLASGVYVYVLETGAQRLTGKLTVMQ